MENCIFCKIINREIKSELFYEDERMIIIKDIAPHAKLHFLAIPKKHYKLLSDMAKSDVDDLGLVFKAIADNAVRLGCSDGYRLIINQGENAGQTVFHLHIHIMGGQNLPFEKFN